MVRSKFPWSASWGLLHHVGLSLAGNEVMVTSLLVFSEAMAGQLYLGTWAGNQEVEGQTTAPLLPLPVPRRNKRVTAPLSVNHVWATGQAGRAAGPGNRGRV